MVKIYEILKRIFDIVASILAIVVLIVPWIIIVIIIKIQSTGPIIYKARRVGLNGKIFTLYKFRSMRVDSGRVRATTLRGDSRIFPFGQFLRDSKLDETPQLVNILKGDMTIIGPRPEDEENLDKFYVGKYERILSIKPGLSSPASLYDYTHGELYKDEEIYIREFIPKKLEIELYYVDHRGVLYDLQIVLRTIVTIINNLLGKKNKEPKEVGLCFKK